MTSLIVAAFLSNALYAVLFASSLQFIGLGDPNATSWGTMLYWAENNEALQTGQYLWAVAPGVVHRAARRGVRPAELRVRRDRQPGAAAGTEDTGQAGTEDTERECHPTVPEPVLEVTRPVRRVRAGPRQRPGGRRRDIRPRPGRVPRHRRRVRLREVHAAVRHRAAARPAGPRHGGSVRFKGTSLVGLTDKQLSAIRWQRHVGGHAERDERAQPGQVGRRPVRRRAARARDAARARRSQPAPPRCSGWSASTRCT